jgi:hypothetical protein
VGLGSDSASLAGGPSTRLLSDEDIEREKYRIIDILNPNVRNPEDVSERLDKVNEIFEQWENSKDLRLAATARYRNNSAITAESLLDGAPVFLNTPGRANVQSKTGRNKKIKGADFALKVVAIATEPIPGVSAAFKGLCMVLSKYSERYDFEDINEALAQALKPNEREPFYESFSLALALINMDKLGNKEHNIRNAPDNKGKNTLKKDPEQRIEKAVNEEKDWAQEDTAKAILELAFGEIFRDRKKLRTNQIVSKLRKISTEEKVERALSRLCREQGLVFNKHVVACRPPRNEEMRKLRRSISAGRFNENPWEEAVPAGGYGTEEIQAIADAELHGTYADYETKEADYNRLLKKANKINGFFHPFDKKTSEAEAKKALKKLNKAEDAYRRLLKKSKVVRSQDTTPAPAPGPSERARGKMPARDDEMAQAGPSGSKPAPSTRPDDDEAARAREFFKEVAARRKQHKKEHERWQIMELAKDVVKLQGELGEGREYWRRMGLHEREVEIQELISGTKEKRWEIKRSLRKQGEDLDYSSEGEIDAAAAAASWGP